VAQARGRVPEPNIVYVPSNMEHLRELFNKIEKLRPEKERLERSFGYRVYNIEQSRFAEPEEVVDYKGVVE